MLCSTRMRRSTSRSRPVPSTRTGSPRTRSPTGSRRCCVPEHGEEPRDPTVIPVATSAPYDVLVGDALVVRLPWLLGDRVQRVGLVFPEDLPDLPGRVRD